jgi:hypothetical protein
MRATRRGLNSSRSGPPFPRLGPHSSASVWHRKRPRADSSKSVLHSRGRRQPSSSETKKSRGLTGS